MLSGETTVRATLDLIAPIFGDTGFRFVTGTNSNPKAAPAFDFARATAMLQKKSCLGFWKENEVSVWIDNQDQNSQSFVFPHSTIRIEPIWEMDDPVRALQVRDWREMAEKLVEKMGVELSMVLGSSENTSDFRRTPLGVGIGLPRVFWIMCFGESYSRLIGSAGKETNFFSRGEFGIVGLKSFISTASFEAYQSASPELLASQRKEIGDDLFNRLPVENRRGGAEAYWIFNPKVIFRSMVFLYRQHTTNWRKYQARVAPDCYVKRKRAIH